MSKEVTTKKDNVPEALSANLDAWGDSNEMTAEDLVIPKILTMQATSKFAKDRKHPANIGDFVNSLTGVVLGNMDTALELIPFHVHKVWELLVDRSKSGKFEWAGFEDYNKLTMSAPRQYHDNDGNPAVRNLVYHIYVLRPSEVKDGSAMPYIVSIKRTSSKAAKKLMTQMYVTNRNQGKVPPAKVVGLTGEEVSNDQNSWIINDLNTVRDSTNEEIAAAFEWMQLVKRGEARIDTSSETDDKNFTSDNVEF